MSATPMGVTLFSSVIKAVITFLFYSFTKWYTAQKIPQKGGIAIWFIMPWAKKANKAFVEKKEKKSLFEKKKKNSPFFMGNCSPIT